MEYKPHCFSKVEPFCFVLMLAQKNVRYVRCQEQHQLCQQAKAYRATAPKECGFQQTEQIARTFSKAYKNETCKFYFALCCHFPLADQKAERIQTTYIEWEVVVAALSNVCKSKSEMGQSGHLVTPTTCQMSIPPDIN
jgi:hypothetical protein